MVRLVGVLVHFFPIDYFDNQRAKVVSGILALLVSLLFVSMALSILATIPMPFIQNHLQASSLSRLLIEHFRLLRRLFTNFGFRRLSNKQC